MQSNDQPFLKTNGKIYADNTYDHSIQNTHRISYRSYVGHRFLLHQGQELLVGQ